MPLVDVCGLGRDNACTLLSGIVLPRPIAFVSTILEPSYYRCCSQTNAYLGEPLADDHVYYLGPISDKAILYVDALSTWMTTANFQ